MVNDMDTLFKVLADTSRRELFDRLHTHNRQTLGERCGHLNRTTRHWHSLARKPRDTIPPRPPLRKGGRGDFPWVVEAIRCPNLMWADLVMTFQAVSIHLAQLEAINLVVTVWGNRSDSAEGRSSHSCFRGGYSQDDGSADGDAYDYHFQNLTGWPDGRRSYRAGELGPCRRP
jgi:hypothetical protein